MKKMTPCLVACLVAVTCDPADPGLEVVAVDLPAQVAVGDSVVFVMRTTNVSDRVVVVPSRREQVLDLVVTDTDGAHVWQSFPEVTTAVLAREVRIAPGQSDVWSERWPLVDSSGLPVAPGTYFITGTLGERRVADSGRRRLTVVEP